MPRKFKSNSKNKKGGGYQKMPTCGPQLDINRYTKPCASGNEMPLDNLFAKYFPQSAGGYSILPDVNIGNLPEVRGYSDCCPPVYTKNGPVWSNNFQPICGQQGGNTERKRQPTKKSKTTKHTKSKHTLHKPRKTKRHSSKKSKTTKRRRTNRKHKGGGVKGMSGVNGNFSPVMTDRTFGCKQPYWEPGCV
jgi:hypothetical protein